MPKRSSIPDANQTTAQIVERATKQNAKDPAAVSLGRRGGIKGGPARAAKLSANRRTAIAKMAAQARWQQRT